MSAAPSPLSRALLIIYLLSLLWLTLFKLSYDISGVLLHHQSRSLNLVPFSGLQRIGWSEAVSNLVTFLPLGLLLAMTFATVAWWRLLLAALAFSATLETLQYALRIGASDVTDVVMNSLGTFVGLLTYRLIARGRRAPATDWFIRVAGLAVFTVFLLLRLFVFRVRY